MRTEVEPEKKSGRVGWSGKMSPEHSAPTTGQTSGRSSKKPSGSSSQKPPLFLCLKAAGPQADASLEWVTGGDSLSPGVYSMHSFGESPSVVVESRLSQILEDSPHQRYSLSAKACLGIIRRSERRGKPLPPMLKDALLEMIERQSTGGSPNP